MISFLLFSKALCPLPRWVLSGDKYPFGPKYLPGVWYEQWPLRKVPLRQVLLGTRLPPPWWPTVASPPTPLLMLQPGLDYSS